MVCRLGNPPSSIQTPPCVPKEKESGKIIFLSSFIVLYEFLAVLSPDHLCRSLVFWSGINTTRRGAHTPDESQTMPGLGPKPFAYISPTENLATLDEKGKVDFDNHWVILTLIHWLKPRIFLPCYSEATLAISSERLSVYTGPYQKKAPRQQWDLNLQFIHYNSELSIPTQLSWPDWIRNESCVSYLQP